jgi:hypothetical protein
MKDQDPRSRKILAYIKQNRLPLAAYFLIALFGFFLGRGLFRAAYLNAVLEKLSGTAHLWFAPINLPSVLFSGLLPPLLYSAVMLLCACERWTLPLWIAAVVISAGIYGFTYTWIAVLAQGCALWYCGVLLMLPPALIPLPAMVLAMFPFSRAPERGDAASPGIGQEAAAFLPWLTAYALLRVTTAVLPLLLLMRGSLL